MAKRIIYQSNNPKYEPPKKRRVVKKDYDMPIVDEYIRKRNLCIKWESEGYTPAQITQMLTGELF